MTKQFMDSVVLEYKEPQFFEGRIDTANFTQFLYSERELELEEIYQKFIDRECGIWIHSILYLYLYDSLCWFPTLDCLYNKETTGFDITGIFAITSKGSGILQKIMSAWISLFQNAPEDIYLRGLYNHQISKNEFLKIPKSKCLEHLAAILDATENVSQGKGILYVFPES